ncbi:MAG: hypothetical protein HZA20_04885 [Nitrospirae bacterium]|nr:hypothetical protein [Nitrospirota bacterium]
MKHVLIAAFAVLGFALLADMALATEKTFPAGSFIIPVDACWQPNNDPAKIAGLPAECDTDANDKGVFQAYGMIYAMLDRGDDPDNCSNKDGSTPFQRKILGNCKSIPIYWGVRSDKKGQHDTDFEIAGNTPLVEILNSKAKNSSGGASPVRYMGGPFVIDKSDLSIDELKRFLRVYPDAKAHVAKTDFTINYDKVLMGRTPKVAVLGEGSKDVLMSYLRVSGLFNWKDYVFEFVNSNQIASGVLDSYQLLWAPHWQIWGEAAGIENSVVNGIRKFLEAGNAGFFQSASISSVESAIADTKVNPLGVVPDNNVTNGADGFLIDRNKAKPRLQVNGAKYDVGTSLYRYPGEVKIEEPGFYLSQCGGWNFKPIPSGGFIVNMRPNMNSGYKYNDTVKRLIHDDPDVVKGAGSYGMGNDDYYYYDYFLGGRVNGSPTGGYITYLAGHSYLQCLALGDPKSPEKWMSLSFDDVLDRSSVVTVEIVHDNCTSGINCPKASLDISNPATPLAVSASDDFMYLNMKSASYKTEGDVSSIGNILYGNLTSNDMIVRNIIVEFPGNAGTKLLTINETKSDGTVTANICSPGSGSRAACVQTGRGLKLAFDNASPLRDQSTKVVMTVVHAGCSGDKTKCPTATFDPKTGKGESDPKNSDGTLKLDMTGSSVDVTAQNLIGISLLNQTGQKVTITDFEVSFGGNRNSELKKIADEKSGDEICEPKDTGHNAVSCLADDRSFSFDMPAPGALPAVSTLGPFASSCFVLWELPVAIQEAPYFKNITASNTCGVKFVLNSLLGLKFQVKSADYGKTMPIVKNNIMYRASFRYPTFRGNLKALDMKKNPAEELWDAAKMVPKACNACSDGETYPTAEAGFAQNQMVRGIFTNKPGSAEILDFSSASRETLRQYLGTARDSGGAKPTSALINTVRGRSAATEILPYGKTELGSKLWAIENSTPALLGCSNVAKGAKQRDKFVLAGADDGMLHAFYAASPDAATKPDARCGNFSYKDHDDANAGKEIWAYIPSTLLPYLKDQPFEPDLANAQSNFEPVVSVDGSPALGDFFIDTNADNKPDSWRTVLVGTAQVKSVNQGIVFAMDVNDPYHPRLIWEKTFNDTSARDFSGKPQCKGVSRNCNMGNTKGAAIGRVQIGNTLSTYVFVTSSWAKKKDKASPAYDCVTNPENRDTCVYGVSITALDFVTGDVVWQTELPYTAKVDHSAANVNQTPAMPSLMDADGNGTDDYAVFGDMQGRLWAIRTSDGKSLKTE